MKRSAPRPPATARPVPRWLVAAAVLAPLMLVAVAPATATRTPAPEPPGSRTHAVKQRPKPPSSLRVTARTTSLITLRWRGARGTAGRFVVFRNRRVVTSTPRSTFTFRRLRCGTRYVVGVRRGGSRIVAVPVRTRACTPTAGAIPPGGGVTRPPAVFPPGSGGTGLPRRLPVSQGAVHHVATSGSDSNPGTAAQPWRTVGKAIDALSPGETAVVHPGIYAESVWTRSAGTAAAPITIRNAEGEAAPIVRAGGAPYALTLASGARYIRFQGLVFEGATGSAPANVTIENGTGNFEFLGVEIRGSAEFGLYTEPQTTAVHVIASRIHHNGGSGRSNRDHNVYLMGTDHVVTSSLITDAPNGYGIQVYPSSARAIISANTIVGNGSGGIILGGEGSQTTVGARVIGNILAFNGGSGLSTYWGGTQGSDNLARGNLAFGNSGGSIGGTGVTVQGTILADPRFVDRAAGDLRLLADSPAVGVGETAFTPAGDVLGQPRPQGSGPDLGAHER